jgi:hypothetical protein
MIDTENNKVYQATTSSSNKDEKSWYKKSFVRFPNALQTPDKSVIIKNKFN